MFNHESDYIWDFLQAVTGWPITADEWYDNMALRILAIQRAVYFEDVGWDSRGIPKASELRRLGLGDVERKLKSFFS